MLGTDQPESIPHFDAESDSKSLMAEIKREPTPTLKSFKQ
jgi:hypothetical protein